MENSSGSGSEDSVGSSSPGPSLTPGPGTEALAALLAALAVDARRGTDGKGRDVDLDADMLELDPRPRELLPPVACVRVGTEDLEELPKPEILRLTCLLAPA